jgi:hypothetical protein
MTNNEKTLSYKISRNCPFKKTLALSARGQEARGSSNVSISELLSCHLGRLREASPEEAKIDSLYVNILLKQI